MHRLQRDPLQPALALLLAVSMAALLALLLLGAPVKARAQQQGAQVEVPLKTPAAPPLDDALAARIRELTARAEAAALPGTRVDIDIGALDPRLKLAPCADVQPYLPSGSRLWGKARIGLRCASGPVRWNVFLPVTVRVFAPALVVSGPLQAGAQLSTADLKVAEVDLAEARSAALQQPALAVGRTLLRPLAAGATVREADLRPRQWFDAGDRVQLVASGSGISVAGEGQAMTPGFEGRSVRVRTDSGRIVSGKPTGPKRVEVPL